MAQLDGRRRYSETSKTPKAQTSPTSEQLLHAGQTPTWQSNTSPKLGKNHDQEEDHTGHNKKSVLTKVKERARKLRHSLSGKKKHGLESPDGNTTPPWGVSLDNDEDDDEDPEYLGAPMYESELAPENYKETARQHPREVPVASEKHVLLSSVKQEDEQWKEEQLPIPNKTMTENMPEKLAPAFTKVQKGKEEQLPSRNKTRTENVSEKLAPTYTKVQKGKDEQLPSPDKTITENVFEKMAPTCTKVQHGKEEQLPSSNETITENVSEKMAPTCTKVQHGKEEQLPSPNKRITETVPEKLAPLYAKVQQKKEEQLPTSSPNKRLTETVSEKLAPTYTKAQQGKEEQIPNSNKRMTKSVSEKLAPSYAKVQQGKKEQLPSPSKRITETMSEKLATTYARAEQNKKEENLPSPNKRITETVYKNLTPVYAEVEQKKENNLRSPNKTITETVSEKLAPAYAAVTDATHTIASKIAGLTVTTPEAMSTGDHVGSAVASPRKYAGSRMEKLDRSLESKQYGTTSPQTWDKGVSVKEYVMQKLEPGEDERALSQVISDAMSPRRTPGDMGVVEKMKEAVSSFLRTDQEPLPLTTKTTNSSSNIPISVNESSLSHNPISTTNTNSSSQISHIRISTTNRHSSPHVSHKPISTAATANSSHIPISTNAHEVIEDQNQGRILQTN